MLIKIAKAIITAPAKLDTRLSAIPQRTKNMHNESARIKVPALEYPFFNNLKATWSLLFLNGNFFFFRRINIRNRVSKMGNPNISSGENKAIFLSKGA